MSDEMEPCSYGCDRERLWREFENVSRKLDALASTKQVTFQGDSDNAFARSFVEMVRRGDIGFEGVLAS